MLFRSDRLAIGMFVAELDRPWLGTPFLIQGFVIESQDQIDELRLSCKHVFVERTLSLGDQYQPDPVEKPAIPQRMRAEPRAKIYDDRNEAAKDDGGGGIIGSIGKIFKSAFSSEGVPSSPERVHPAQPSAPREPVVIIYRDQPKIGRAHV